MLERVCHGCCDMQGGETPLHGSLAAVGANALLLTQALQIVQLARQVRLLRNDLELCLRVRPHQMEHLREARSCVRAC